MKNIFLLLFALFFLSRFTTAEAQTQYCSNSDAFGYCMRTDTSKETPITYSWIDTPNDAQQVLGMSDDNFAGPFPLGFPFKYYWNEQTEVYVGSNGYLMFGRPVNVASSGTGFPEFPLSGGSGTPNNYIGAFLTDLTFTDLESQPIADAKIFVFNADNGNKFVVTYENVPFWHPEDETPSGYEGGATFQVILDKTDNSIAINYKSVKGEVARTYTNRPGTTWLSYGMENSNGEVGMTFLKNDYPKDGSAIKVFYPEKIDYKVKDVAPAWVFNEQSYGIIKQINDAPFKMKAAVKNVGTETVTDVNLRRVVYDYFAGNSTLDALTQIVKIDKLEVGETKEVEFDLPLVFENAANYRVAVRAIYPDDEVSTNQEISGEIIAKDFPNDAGEYTIGYDQFTVSNQYEGAPTVPSIVSRFEVGVYYTMPFYPCYVRGAIAGLWMRPNGELEDTLVGYKMKIFDDSGLNGTPGKVIENMDVSPEDITAAMDQLDETLKDTKEPFFLPIETRLKKEYLVDNNKGLYLSFKGNSVGAEEGIHNDFLFVDEIPGGPISSRTFEITGGLWAPYRDRNNSDFLLQLLVSRKPNGRENLNLILTEDNIFPNPASDQAKVSFQLKQRGNVDISIYNSIGQVVRTIELGTLETGVNSTVINTGDFAPGIYTYTLKVGDETISNKFVVNR